ncbi:hypothetical protein DPMN_079263 [Dreissena polymorpha]|uniref:Uncharacterized protein n=1 Tax=Dreissena polymorpha TaxID=45954 RepID=A0A9D4BSU7_DREPO|nr:hypothetical protein DPMN_079263 [Dreissena polymorpha]
MGTPEDSSANSGGKSRRTEERVAVVERNSAENQPSQSVHVVWDDPIRRSEQEKLAHQLARANSPTQDVPDDFHEQAAQFSETDDDDEEPKLPVFQAHVQGKFAESDLLEIIQLTSNKLISENLTVDEVNAKFQEILQECMLVLTNKQTEEKDVCCLRPEINDFNFMVNTKQPENLESVLKVHHVKIDASTQTESTGIEFDFETLFCLIQTIQKSVSDMRKDVCEHILNTNRGFNEMKDIIHSVKVNSTTNSRGTDDKCDCLQENVQDLKQTLDQFNISVQKKFQSLGDILKANSIPSVLSKGYMNGSVEATSKRMSDDPVENDTLLETEQRSPIYKKKPIKASIDRTLRHKRRRRY